MTSKRHKTGKAAGLKMDDVARLAGVSKSTVSRALSDSPLVNEETKKRIRALAARHNYTIDERARNFRLRQTNTIAVVIHLTHDIDQHVSDPFFLDLLGHIADTLAERGYDLLLSKVVAGDADWLERLAATRRSDGLILLGQSTQHAIINQFAAQHPAMVVWGAKLPRQRYTTVGGDNVAGGAKACAHLLAQGRRHIAFLGDTRVPEIRHRHQGYVEALAKAGLKADPKLTLPVHFSSVAAYEAMREFLRGTIGRSGGQRAWRADQTIGRQRIDAVFAGSDVIAMSAIKALRESGLAVPGDVAVVGYDDIPLAAYVDPPLTTVRQDTSAAARLLVDSLLDRLAGRPAPSVVLDPVLVVRASSSATR
ncbi:MAG: LacI family DNA-binding transcriptional regulator [Pseudomonadota bacterium]